jgi:endonuclease/exonuclease/phosphatase family metal-dependent hydrolase
LYNALSNPSETRKAKKEKAGENPKTKSWTHRYKKSGKPPKHELYDHIWLSKSLAKKIIKAFIDRRKTHGGDGSDHDPAWIELKV